MAKKRLKRSILAFVKELPFLTLFLGALTVAATLMFGGFLAPFALGVLTNVLITLSLAVIAYTATKHLFSILENIVNPSWDSITKSMFTGLKQGAPLLAASLVLGGGITLAAMGIWAAATLPLAISIAVVVFAAYSFSNLINNLFHSGKELAVTTATSIKNRRIDDKRKGKHWDGDEWVDTNVAGLHSEYTDSYADSYGSPLSDVTRFGGQEEEEYYVGYVEDEQDSHRLTN